jgi:hypothetical protein
MATLEEATEAYLEEFDELPTVAGIPPDKEELAAAILMEAVDNDLPLMDEQFYKKLGLDMYEEDDVV